MKGMILIAPFKYGLALDIIRRGMAFRNITCLNAFRDDNIDFESGVMDKKVVRPIIIDEVRVDTKRSRMEAIATIMLHNQEAVAIVDGLEAFDVLRAEMKRQETPEVPKVAEEVPSKEAFVEANWFNWQISDRAMYYSEESVDEALAREWAEEEWDSDYSAAWNAAHHKESSDASDVLPAELADRHDAYCNSVVAGE